MTLTTVTLLGDIEYLSGEDPFDILADLKEMSGYELDYTLQELKSGLLAKLMQEEDKS